MSEKHTDGALRAAEALWDDEKRFGPHSNKANYVTKATTIIDHETGLPELKARIDQLEVEKVEAKALLERSAILLKEWSQAYRTTLAKSENDKG